MTSIVALASLWLMPLAVSAQSEADAVTLARLAVHESGWDSPADVALVHAVLAGIVERDGVSYQRAAELAAPRLARCEVSRRWVCGLNGDASRPAHWRGASWSRYRERWLSMIDTAQRVIAGEVPSTCARPPRVWGSRADVLRGIRRGRRWIDAECIGAMNHGGTWR